MQSVNLKQRTPEVFRMDDYMTAEQVAEAANGF